MQTEGRGVLRNINGQRTLSDPLLLMFFFRIQQLLTLKMMTEEEKER